MSYVFLVTIKCPTTYSKSYSIFFCIILKSFFV